MKHTNTSPLAQIMAAPVGETEPPAQAKSGSALPLLLLGGATAWLLFSWLSSRKKVQEQQEQIEHLLAEKEEAGEEVSLAEPLNRPSLPAFDLFF